MTTSLKGLRWLADRYRPRMRDRDEAAGVDERPEVPSVHRNTEPNMRGLGTLAKRRTLNRHETDQSVKAYETNARQREKR